MAVAVDNNNNSGSNSSDGREESSRALFQGLFKDLGKQAMAMEAIMRVVCGKVDKLETWVTEMSYGMTELDLKLRNIAHNIEGTAANVDEAASVSRWAVPPDDDVAAMKKAATMVVKKVGPSNKQMRMSGMVAGILDRLTDVPATSESEHKPHKKKSKRPTTVDAPSIEPIEDGGDVMSGSEGATVAVASKPRKAKKKKTSKSEAEKEKEEVPVVVEDTSSAVTAEVTMEPTVEAENPPPPPPPDEETLVPTATEPETERSEDVSVVEESEVQPTVTLETVEERAESEEHPSESQQREEATPEDASDTNEDTNDVNQEQREQQATANDSLESASVHSVRDDVPLDTNEREELQQLEERPYVVQHQSEELESDQVVDVRDRNQDDVEVESTVKKESEHIEPMEAQHDTVENGANQEPVAFVQGGDSKQEPIETPPLTPQDAEDPQKEAISIREHQQVDGTECSPTSAGHFPSESKESDSQQPTVLASLPIDHREEEPAAAAEMKIESQPENLATLSADVDVTLSTEERTASIAPSHVEMPPSKIPDTVDSVPPVTRDDKPTTAASQSSSEAPTLTPASLHSNDETDHTAPNVAQPPPPTNDVAAARALRRQSTRRARKEAADASKQGSGRRVSSRAQKAAAAKAPEAPAATATTVAPVVAQPPPSVQKNETQPPQKSQGPASPNPTPTPQKVAMPPTVTKADTREEPKKTAASNPNEEAEENEEEEEEESDSFSNSSDSDANSDDSDSDQSIVDLSGSVKGAALLQGGGAEGAVAASRLTRTLTALNKLKKANMLSPEEAEELRKRAHGKWFKLRDHIKEKQKKDMANIMLKRKKNIFTVSNRIELLEEKSREVYASIKQLNADIKGKVDAATFDGLRRHVYDVQVGLQLLDQKLAQGSSPAMERVRELGKVVESQRLQFLEELAGVREQCEAHQRVTTQRFEEHWQHVEQLDHACHERLAALAKEIDARFQQLPDHADAIENLRRLLRRKADLKLLKELEARFLGHDADSEDCLVRCLSCHKEVVTLPSDMNAGDDGDAGQTPSSHLKRVNPGTSSAKVYRSSTPLSAQPMTISESAPELYGLPVVEEVPGSAASTRATTPKLSARRADDSKASPLSRMNVTASKINASPADRPISAPMGSQKKKAAGRDVVADNDK